MPENQILITERLSLHLFTTADAPFILELLNTPGFLQFIGDRDVRSLDQARHYIESKFMASYQEHGYGPYLLRQKSDGQPVGLSSLVNRPAIGGVDIGYAILPAYEGRGFATEATLAVRDYALQELGINPVLGIVQPDHPASIRVLEKAGLHFVKEVMLEGETSALLLYST